MTSFVGTEFRNHAINDRYRGKEVHMIGPGRREGIHTRTVRVRVAGEVSLELKVKTRSETIHLQGEGDTITNSIKKLVSQLIRVIIMLQAR